MSKNVTIELPETLAAHLIEIGKELATQDNMHSSWPVWYVTEIKKVQAPEDNAEHKERLDDDAFYPDEMLCKSCKEKWSDGELPADCDNYRCDDSFYYYNEERQYATYGSVVFLTKKACQEYIDANSYHFDRPEPYCDSMFRNHEMQPIVQALILMSGNKLPEGGYYGRTEET